MRDFSIDLIWAKFQMGCAALGGWLGYFLGGEVGILKDSKSALPTGAPELKFGYTALDGLMIALLAFMVLDYVTGLMCAVADKKLSSAVGFKGICKKVLILILVGVAHIVDMYVVSSGSALRGAVICFYLSNEGLSLLENAAHIGLPIPEKLKDILAQLHNREEKDSANDAGQTGSKSDGQ